MKVTKEQAAQNRQAIIDAAARMFREQGIDGVGLNDLMKAAGFTHGGFYNHFASKEALVAEVCDSAFSQAVAGLNKVYDADPDGSLKVFQKNLEEYLSADHRDNPACGCPAAALVVDTARQGDAVQCAYAKGIEGFVTIFEKQLTREMIEDGADPETVTAAVRERAISTLSSMIGSLVLSRAIAHAAPALSDEILSVGRKRLTE
ncbi:TetR family transcriptional regulator [Capsulimonas corticalis]|uniref:TetR family transcriptional regulator n=1 Tax=Capsulimonas corticalis TaxID=2219043 RepID=A0A402D2V2_9BACT|nr:TetR/AcrR family transcriptional regulator [Capsulimonas corticalis]BDI28392.1 TetR family transcriptional regulator [Capsulimonas corticalis]